MKAVLISIQPKWCELIASGEKTIEVRKTKPNIKVPFKVYIYETKALYKPNGCKHFYEGRGQVIGEFVCDQIDEIGYSPEMHGKYISDIDDIHYVSCLDFEQMFDYLADGYGYGWHISNLVIYDKPKDLGEFKKINRECWYADLGLAKRDCPECNNADCFMQRPPQSWCYVERKEDGNAVGQRSVEKC